MLLFISIICTYYVRIIPSSIIKSIMCNSKLLKRLIIPVFCRPILSQLVLDVFRCDYLETYFILKKLLKPIIKYRDSWIVITMSSNNFQVYLMMHYIEACYCLRFSLKWFVAIFNWQLACMSDNTKDVGLSNLPV